MADRLLTGWGRTVPTRADLVELTSDAAARSVVTGRPARGVVARGLGRSYGDAAQNAGGVVLDATALAGPPSLDAESATVVCDAGVSLDAIMRAVVPQGFFVAVTPGTRYVTVGGAIAADIHGKNHHVVGSFCRHVDWIDLLDGHGEVRRLTPAEAGFWATAGGMGLTGVVLRAQLRLQRVETSRMLVDTERARDLDDLLERLSSRDHLYDYSVAWIDCLAGGAKAGRGVITRGCHAALGDLGGKAAQDPLSFDPAVRLGAPPWVPGGLLRPLTVAAFNEAWFRKAPVDRVGEVQSIAAFFHPLDGVRAWNRIYGSRGFLQYQFVVPYGAEAMLRGSLELLRGIPAPSFLAVLKRFGPADEGMLSFPTEGWTLALDVPAATPGLAAALDELDGRVAEAGGRIYLAKDSRLRRDLLPTMYPRLDEWRGVREDLDPQGVFASDLSRRLGLVTA